MRSVPNLVDGLSLFNFIISYLQYGVFHASAFHDSIFNVISLQFLQDVAMLRVFDDVYEVQLIQYLSVSCQSPICLEG